MLLFDTCNFSNLCNVSILDIEGENDATCVAIYKLLYRFFKFLLILYLDNYPGISITFQSEM